MRRRVAARNRHVLAAAVNCLLVLTATPTAAQESLVLGDRPQSTEPLVLREVLRIGSLDGGDAFGGISHVALRRDGSVLVADERNRQISLYDPQGRLTARVGRYGQGPGEYVLPWHLSVIRGDSVLVWDLAVGRMSVLTPTLGFARSFPLPQAWNIASLHELPSGELLIAAFDVKSGNALHVVSREGRLLRSFARIEVPPGVVRFHQSVLGGSATVLDSLIVFSHRSPYRIDVFDHRGTHLRSCRGSAGSTTPPEDVIEARPNGARLHWSRYVHSTAVLRSADPGVVLNVIVDRDNRRTTLDAVDVGSCSLVRRSRVPLAVYLQDALGDGVAGSTERDFPEVLVYALDLGEPEAY